LGVKGDPRNSLKFQCLYSNQKITKVVPKDLQKSSK